MIKLQHLYGFGLLEVLIATFILAFGMLGIAGVYLHSFKSVENSYWQTLAFSQLVAVTEQLRVADYNYTSWRKECEQLLPHGKCKCQDRKIRVCWGAKKNKQCLNS